MKARILGATGILLALVLLLAVNILGARIPASGRIDLTENGLYTLSQGTRKILSSIDEPITLKLYMSRRLASQLPGISTYARRVEALLQEYVRVAEGGLKLEVIDPEPFSEAEDRAVSYGLRGVPTGEGEDSFYFGLVGTNSVGDDSVIPFLSRDRAKFLEYDLSKLVYTLAHPDKKVVGVLTTLPLDGTGPQAGMGGAGDPWVVMEQMRQLYDVEVLDPKLTSIPAKVDVLMLVHPKGLSAAARYAIDQYVLAGGHALVFVDPNAEAEQGQRMQGFVMPPKSRASDLGGLLKAWGLDFDTTKVVGDLSLAAKVRMQRGGRVVTFDYPVWFNVREDLVDQADIVTGNLGNISFGTPGSLKARDDAGLKVTTLIRTTDQAREYDVSAVAPGADPEALARDYKPGGTPFTLAVRVTGHAKSAFPDGPPKADEQGDGAAQTPAKADEPKKPHLTESSAPMNLIVVADTDLLSDRFWVNVQNFLGTRLAVPTASNGNFVINAIDNLLGSGDLISVRNRGTFVRPFDRVRELRQAAEQRYQRTEEELQKRLKDTESRLIALEKKKPGGQELVLTAEQQREIEQFRSEKLRIRKALRDVQHNLRADIDRLDMWLKFVNIALVPLLIGLGGLGAGLWRARRRAAAARAAA